jgi:hypothetical protein
VNALQTSHLSIINNPAFKKVIVYLVLTFTLCIPFYYTIISTGEVEAGGGIYVIGLMWCPGLAAEEFLQHYQNQKLLEAINAAYDDLPDPEEETLHQQRRFQHRQLIDEHWMG